MSSSRVIIGRHWGTRELSAFIAEQRDLYTFMHGQTCRMMNTGLTGSQIAERFRLPEGLQRKWHTQGFYGSVSHNVKVIYQRYLTWFDGNPAHLWQHPPEEEVRRVYGRRRCGVKQSGSVYGPRGSAVCGNIA